ncbi:hypothetical protein CRUP_037116 [Coryphaenoides rupestris]|nr:hypothetical protein CRUP_037116 [Coryphaenoides rupestris]
MAPGSRGGGGEEAAGGEGEGAGETAVKVTVKKRRRRKTKSKEGKTRTVHANVLYEGAGEEQEEQEQQEEEKKKKEQKKKEENPNAPAALRRQRDPHHQVHAAVFLPRNLFEQFHRFANVYFVFIALLNFAPVVRAFQPELALAPVLFILSVTAVKDLWEDYRRHRSDAEINHMDCLVYSRALGFCDISGARAGRCSGAANTWAASTPALLEPAERRYLERFWKQVRVGDFIRLRCNEILPADVLLLSSSDPDRLVHGSGRKCGLYKENLLLRGCTVRNTEEAVGIVIYAGRSPRQRLLYPPHPVLPSSNL